MIIELDTSDKIIDALASNKITLTEAKSLIIKMIDESSQTLKVSLDLGSKRNPHMPPIGMKPSDRYRLFPPGPLPGGGCRY